MERSDLISSIFWAVIAVIFGLGSLPYGFGSTGVPGAGFLPFLTGLTLFGLSILNFLLSIKKERSPTQPHEPPKDYPTKEKTKRVLIVLAALLFYVIALERLGFVITSFLFMVIVIALDFRKWPLVLLASFSFTTLFYILFRFLLRVPLPLGILGI